MHMAIEDLGLEHLEVVHPGDRTYALDDKVTAIPLKALAQPAGQEMVLSEKTRRGGRPCLAIPT
jgi:hypothetical protein